MGNGNLQDKRSATARTKKIRFTRGELRSSACILPASDCSQIFGDGAVGGTAHHRIYRLDQCYGTFPLSPINSNHGYLKAARQISESDQSSWYVCRERQSA